MGVEPLNHPARARWTAHDVLAAARRFLAVSSDDPDLLKAQFRALAYQLPLLYAILLVSGWIMAWPHLGLAPAWLALGAPIALTALCASRGLRWAQRLRAAPSTDEALTVLRRTNVIAPLLTAALVTWAMLLYPYGDARAQAQVALFMGITATGCIFCLIHLRSAAFLVALISNSAVLAFFGRMDDAPYFAGAVNVALVTATLLAIVLFHFRDFARMVKLNAENRQLANCDSLTGLPNRRQFFDSLDAAVEKSRSTGKMLSVGILDLDGFKPVNDLYGHVIGDRLLCAVTERLQLLCGDRMILARLGGDEFALLLTASQGNAELQRVGDAWCEALRAPFQIGDATIQIGGSLGFASFPEHAQSGEQLYEFADYALYQGKRFRPGATSIFTTAHDIRMQREAAIELALRTADLDREMTVAFQPIVDVATSRTVAFEALARWTSATLGPVPPGQFIPIAERSGLIGRLTVLLLDKALDAARHWPEAIRLSFNLSAHDLRSPQNVLRIIHLLNASPIDPRRVDLEITETALLQDIDQVRDSIRMLKLLGCSVSLDDFGTGFSSLSHLHALPFTKIKIDRSFVQAMNAKPASYKIVKSLLALTRDMDIDCIVEGVETTEEMAALRSLGGRMVQGFYFAAPMPECEVAVFLSQGETTASLSQVG